MWSRILMLMLLSAFARAQQSSPAPQVDNDFVHAQFGAACDRDPQFAPMTGDLNGDGVEDLVLVARCKHPMIDQDENNFKVIDPMDSFYGYGNPKVTSSFAQDDPRLKGISILVIHGSGSDAWHSATPLAKFLVINQEVKMVTLKKMKLNKKKSVTAIYVEEANGEQMTAAIYWDGKKYKYEPLGSAME